MVVRIASIVGAFRSSQAGNVAKGATQLVETPTSADGSKADITFPASHFRWRQRGGRRISSNVKAEARWAKSK
jgi:hypothetical protein